MAVKQQNRKISIVEGSVRQRQNGTYELRISTGKMVNGKPQYKSIYGKTKKELKECVCECDRTLLELGDKKGKIDFERSFALAFAWCQEAFGRLNKINEG